MTILAPVDQPYAIALGSPGVALEGQQGSGFVIGGLDRSRVAELVFAVLLEEHLVDPHRVSVLSWALMALMP